ncbi:HRDC domain-containing protein [Ammoniphilus resinae]|uniref:HRDC domain-containing protein n=1 Tax=Ammoniphilus resinae TaxID=861532 RepID=A0ABS4GTY3_9BACL|nr:HRDC domain-containing protein [Ammoniphilus resinae]MBP1933724.1 hypothetical protein [Ammoniphilus resinae]
MLNEIQYLISLDRPPFEKGKIIILKRSNGYETHWSYVSGEEESLETLYSGPELERAWLAAEATRQARCRDGFRLQTPHITFYLSAIPKPFLTVRKLECFCSKHHDANLFQELREWRRTASNAAKVPPYFIGTDRLLSIIAALVPQKEEELLQIPGIGQTKLDSYGQEILKITNKYPQIYSFPLDWIQRKVSEEELATWLLEDKIKREERHQVRMKQELEEKRQMLEAIEDQISIGNILDKMSLTMVQFLKRIRELSRDGYDVLPYLQQEVERIKEKDQIVDLVSSLGNERLKPIFEKLYGSMEELPRDEKGEKYNHIRLVCTYLQIQSAA